MALVKCVQRAFATVTRTMIMTTAISRQQKRRRNWKKSSAMTLVALAATGLLVSISQAAVSDFSGFDSGRQLSDAELGQMRGRFVDKGQIMFFGVQMSSEWRTSAGEHLSAGATLRGDLSGATPRAVFEPHLTVGSVDSLAVSMSGNGAVVRDGGTGNAYGVVQTIQAGGNFNAAANDLQIDVLDAAGHSMSVAVSSNPSVPTQVSASGVELSVSNGAGGVRVGMNSSMGAVTQAILPGQGLRQSIQLTSDFQQVRNLTRLQLYMGQRSANADVPGVRSAVESARHLRR